MSLPEPTILYRYSPEAAFIRLLHQSRTNRGRSLCHEFQALQAAVGIHFKKRDASRGYRCGRYVLRRVPRRPSYLVFQPTYPRRKRKLSAVIGIDLTETLSEEEEEEDDETTTALDESDELALSSSDDDSDGNNNNEEVPCARDSVTEEEMEPDEPLTKDLTNNRTDTACSLTDNGDTYESEIELPKIIFDFEAFAKQSAQRRASLGL
jgi:hypothetical protein